MERITLTLSSDLFDEGDQDVSVRKNLGIHALIAEVVREFNLPEGSYALYLKGSDRPLDFTRTIEQLGIQTGAELVFGREQHGLSQQMVMRGGGIFQMITSPVRGFLREESTGQIFEINWQPAVIGRPDNNNPASADTLVANLGDLPEARTVSRRHASISEMNGQYYLESLSEKNPTYLNDHELVFSEKRALKNGDKIRVGKIVLTFGLKAAPRP